MWATRGSMIAHMITRRPRRYAITVAVAWLLLAGADAAAVVGVLPWLPMQVSILAVGACLAATVLVTSARSQAPVRAAFLDGMLYERQTGATQILPTLPIAVGDGIAPVVRINSGVHRRPSPRRPGR
jgi:hypothetical protein